MEGNLDRALVSAIWFIWFIKITGFVAIRWKSHLSLNKVLDLQLNLQDLCTTATGQLVRTLFCN